MELLTGGYWEMGNTANTAGL